MEKPLEDFDKRKGEVRKYKCKACRRVEHHLRKEETNARRLLIHNERMKDPEYCARYREKCNQSYQRNKEKRSAYAKANRTKLSAQRKKRYPFEREKIIERQRKLREKQGSGRYVRRRELRQLNLERNRAYEREYSRERRKRDLHFRILGNLRNRIRLSLENKSECTRDLLGCSLDEFVKHLESQFSPEMTWTNYGFYWEIDHIRPCCSFDLTDPEQQKICFHYTNCRPLSGSDNRAKIAQDIRQKLGKVDVQEKTMDFHKAAQTRVSIQTESNSLPTSPCL